MTQTTKYLLLIFLLVFIGTFTQVKAQDLIVTKNGDSLNVEILKVSNEHILYLAQSGNHVKRIKQLKTEIKSFRYIFYSKERRYEYSFDPNDIRFRLAISGGLSWLLDGADENASEFFAEYVNDLNSSWHVKVEANYFFRNGLGIGAVVDQYRTSGRVDNVIFIDQMSNDTIIGPLSDNLLITYVGPQITYHIKSGFKNVTFFAGAGAGINFYKDELERVDPFTAKGTAFGLHGALGVDFLVTENVLVGFELSGTTGNLRDFTLTGVDGVENLTDQDNDISRINLSFGIRFIK